MVYHIFCYCDWHSLHTSYDCVCSFPLVVTVFDHLFLLSLYSEADEILKICNVIGCPDEQTWPQGLSLAEAMKYQFPQVNIHVSLPIVLLL